MEHISGSDMLLYIVAISLQVGLLVYFAIRSRKKKQVSAGNGNPFSEGSYRAERYAALHVSQQQLGLSIAPDTIKVFGVVMDWEMGGTTLSLCTYITGAANALLSTGATAMGAGRNPAVAELASDFVQVAQNFILRAVPVTETGLPAPGTVRFYFLTNQGLYSAQELLADIDADNSPWTILFFRGNMVMNEIKGGQ